MGIFVLGRMFCVRLIIALVILRHVLWARKFGLGVAAFERAEICDICAHIILYPTLPSPLPIPSISHPPISPCKTQRASHKRGGAFSWQRLLSHIFIACHAMCLPAAACNAFSPPLSTLRAVIPVAPWRRVLLRRH